MNAVRILLVSLLIAGCAGGTNPSVPSNDFSSHSNISHENSHYIWGMWWVLLDPSDSTWEIIPVRTGELHVNVRQFLESGSPCSDCFGISSFVPGTPYATVGVKIKHPWPGLTQFTGFDVRGIAMWKGSETWSAHGLRTQKPNSNDAYVGNADGYTTLFNPTDYAPGSAAPIFSYSKGKFATQTFPDSTLNPYIDYYTNETRRMFEVGQTVTKNWQVKMPSGGPFVLGYAIDASWATPSPNPPNDPVTDFPENANRAEAYRVEAIQTTGLGSSTGSTCDIAVRAWDWQDNAATAYIECPEIFNGKVEAWGTGFNGEYTEFSISVTNEKGAPDGTYRALISVIDGIDSGLPKDHAAYTFMNISIGNMPPHASVNVEKYIANKNEMIFFQSTSTDPDGPTDIAQWWWDWENDGVWDEQGSSISHGWPAPGVYHVDHRVVDQGGLEDDLESDEIIEITVIDPCCDNVPVAAAEASVYQALVFEDIQFTSFSYDPDGVSCIDKLEWDFDGDGTYEEQGDILWKKYNQPGIYNVQHRIRDDCGLTDILDEPLVIEIFPDCCDVPPVAQVSDVPLDIITGMEIALTSESYDPESPACKVDVYWDTDDDGEFDDSTDKTVYLQWDEPGFYFVGLKAEDECGLTDEIKIKITVHIGITWDEDNAYKTINTKYSYLSESMPAAIAAQYVDVMDTDGPWDFTGLPLVNHGNYRVALSPNHPEVAPFKSDFFTPYERFYKTEGVFDIVDGAVYFAENYGNDPITLMWVGLHEDEQLGSVNLIPSAKNPFPFWIYSDFSYQYGFLPLFLFTYNFKGWGEGNVKVPWNGTDEFALLVQYEIKVESSTMNASVLVYEWMLDNGTVVAMVAAINNENGINYDPDTGMITGTATYNALFNVGPY